MRTKQIAGLLPHCHTQYLTKCENMPHAIRMVRLAKTLQMRNWGSNKCH